MENTSISGDKGAFISTSIISDIWQNMPLIGTLQAELGFDYGIVDVEDLGVDGTEKLLGWRVGASTKYDILDLSITYAKAIKPSNLLQHNREEWYFPSMK